MAKCTRKLIDAEAAKEAIRDMFDDHGKWTSWAMIHDALDALPDASEKAIHAERIPVPPHLAEAQRVVIDRAAKSQKSEWSRQHIDQWRKGSESEKAQQAGDGAEEK